jgi:hypothetical protein
MTSGYERDPGPIGPSSRRTAVVVVAAVLIFLGVVVAKPWAGPASVERQTRAPASSLAPAAAVPPSSTSARPEAALRAVPATPPWPAATGHLATAEGPTLAARAAASLSLAVHAGTWGVGDGGAGPRLIRDEPWLDWQDVVPEAASDAPGRVATWPDTPLCEHLPILFDQPSFIAVTVPLELRMDWRLEGWWSGGGQVESLLGSVRLAAPSGVDGIVYVDRLDSQPWPDGRYEFHVVAPDSTMALTFCLART